MVDLKVNMYKAMMIPMRMAFKMLPDIKPTLFTGTGSALQLADNIAQSGAQRVLVVTDSILLKLGIIDPIANRMTLAGLEVFIFDGVEPDPSFEVVEFALDSYYENNCDTVFAIGGGSTIDAAKVVSISAGSNKAPKSLVGMMKMGRCVPAPFYALPTTAGTGSEVTAAAVITDRQMETKCMIIEPRCIPIAAALDGSVMIGIPPSITAATGMDAMTHAVESYLSKFSNSRTEQNAIAAVKMINQQLPRCYADGNDIDGRQDMALASCYAGMAFTRTSVGYVHAIAHQLGAKYHVPHGLANAMVLPRILEFYKPAVFERLADLALACDLGARDEDEYMLAEKFIARIWEMNAQMNIPATCSDLMAHDIPNLAKRALKEAHYNYPVPLYMNQETCEALLRGLLAN